MTIFITMLRGINVSGQKKIKMEELRKLYESLEFQDIRSYIQSGNIIFKTHTSDRLKIISSLRESIFNHFGFDVSIILRTSKELERIVSNNPFHDKDTKRILVSFLAEENKNYNIDELLQVKAKGEEFKIKGKEIYLFLPYGSGKTKLTNNFFERKLGVQITTRNWKTVNKILDISKDIKDEIK